MQPINNDSITMGNWTTGNISTVEAHKYTNRPLFNSTSTYYSPMRTTTPYPVSASPSSECYSLLSFVNKYMDCTQLAALELGVIGGFIIVFLACCCAKFVGNPIRRPVQSERIFTFSPTQSVDSDSDDEQVNYLDVFIPLSPSVINDEVAGISRPVINDEVAQIEMMETYMGLLGFTSQEDSEEKDDILSVDQPTSI